MDPSSPPGLHYSEFFLPAQRNCLRAPSPPCADSACFKFYTTFAAHFWYIRRQGSIPSGSFDQVVAVLRTAGCGGVVFCNGVPPLHDNLHKVIIKYEYYVRTNKIFS
uniref:Uncharacterized protein n=1 Tax=Hyaloperonospora arabidopsidis (strain Emoy2) TaxID=559515 RepID=M4BQZ3_HYAAE